MKEALTETSVLELDPAVCLSPDDNPPVKDDELAELLGSIREDGQLVAGIVSRHPTLTGNFLVVAGNRRRRCSEILGVPFRAELIDRVLSRPEIIKIRVGENVHRKKPSPFQLCKDVSDYMEERKLSTWAEVGRELSLLPPTICRITSVRRIPLTLRASAERVAPSICWMIAALPNGEAMEKAFAFATTPGTDGRLPTRDQVGRHVEQFKVKRQHGRKAKLLKGEVEGRSLSIEVVDDDTGESLIEFFRAIAGRLGKYRDLPAGNLGFLFNG